MSLTLASKQTEKTEQQEPTTTRWQQLRILLSAWELYPILLITVFSRLYRIDTTVFMDDEAVVFRMAHDAIAHGLWSITSNRSSVGNLNPPLVVYLFTLPAAISANPVWGAALVGLCNSVAVLLTYIFMRRYYGRLAATLTCLLYATSVTAILYSRNIWPQNFLPFFTVLFLFTIFKGVIERRKGWLFPAVLLVGVQYQLHGTGIFLAVPLFCAIVFAFKTIRVRDIVFSVVGLLVLFSPFIFWEFASNFSDVKLLLTAKSPYTIDGVAFQLYKFILSPYIQDIAVRIDQLPTDPASLLLHTPLHYLRRVLELEHLAMPFLLICAFIAAGARMLWPARSTDKQAGRRRPLQALLNWWSGLLASPYRQGLVLLLSWQIVPLLALIRHSIHLEPHYFIIYLPGQFMLIALLFTGVIDLVRRNWSGRELLARSVVALVAAFFIGAQLLGSVIFLSDNIQGNFNGAAAYPYYNDLSSLQQAMTKADTVAQQQHLKRIYVSGDDVIWSAMNYLAEQPQTPTTVFDTTNTFVLPSPQAGPVVFLARPYNPLDEIILQHYTHATLVDQSQRIGGPGAPFKIYILSTLPLASPAPQSFTSSLQLLSPRMQSLPAATPDQQLVVTRWQFAQTINAAPRAVYHYHFHTQLGNEQASNDFDCKLSSTWAGDQLFFFQGVASQTSLPASAKIGVSTYTTVPVGFNIGTLQLVTYNVHDIDRRTLVAADGQQDVLVVSGAGA